SFQLGRATRMQLATVAVAAAVNLGLNVALIPRLGIAGAAWATLAAYTMALVASVWLGRRVLVLPVPWVGLGRIGLAVTGMILVLLPLRIRGNVGTRRTGAGRRLCLRRTPLHAEQGPVRRNSHVGVTKRNRESLTTRACSGHGGDSVGGCDRSSHRGGHEWLLSSHGGLRV
ncbi:MAG: hypothetical protein E4H37_04460, partial [Gemmatimonadales bacterium]